MNIGIFTDTYFPQLSGVSTSIKTLCEQLEKDGHHVYIFTTTDPKVKRSSYGKGSEKSIYRFSSVPFAGFKDRRVAVRGFFEAVEIARTLRLDIVHTQTEFSLGLTGQFVARQLKIPSIHTYHTMYSDYTHYVAGGRVLQPKNVKTLVRAYLKPAKGVIAPSPETAQILKEYQVKAPIRIIPTGVPLRKNAVDNSDVIKKQLGITNRNKIVLSLGRVAREKSIDELINSFANILPKNPEAVLIIAGDGPAKEELEELVNELGIQDSVRFTGFVPYDQAYSYYKMADVFVSTSTTETQGLTFAEALSAGTPYIAKPNSYLKPITKNKSVGTIVKTSQEIQKAISDYLKHPQYKKNHKTRNEVLEKISAEKFARSVAQFYVDVIEDFVPPRSTVKALTVDEFNYVKTMVTKIPKIKKPKMPKSLQKVIKNNE